MQKAFDKMSVKAVTNHQPQSCDLCGDEGHSYKRCPFARRDEETEHVNSLNSKPSYFPRLPFTRTYSKDSVEQQNWNWKPKNPTPFNNPSSSNNNRNFYHNTSFNNSNNRGPQTGPPKLYIAPTVSEFMHEQGKMNQMMLEQMQEISAQVVGLAAHNKMMETQLGHQTTTSQPPHCKLLNQPEPNPREEVKAITLRSGTQYTGAAMPVDSAAQHTDRADPTRAVHSEETIENNPVSENTTLHMDCADSTRLVHKEGQSQRKKRTETQSPYRPPVPFP